MRLRMKKRDEKARRETQKRVEAGGAPGNIASVQKYLSRLKAASPQSRHLRV